MSGNQKWVCEFCEQNNFLTGINETDRPQLERFFHMEAPAPVQARTDESSIDNRDYNVIFVIDVSGSMGSTVYQVCCWSLCSGLPIADSLE